MDSRGNAGNPRIIPPGANAYGMSYGEWAAGWMQWAIGASAAENPVGDQTGEFCAVGQEGKVWYLAGTFGDTDLAEVPLPVTERACTVSADKALFFPVVNVFFFRTEPEEPTDPDEIREMLLSWLTAEAYCEIDGEPVENLEAYLTESPIFEVTIPDDNLWADYGLPGGSYEPAATTGLYLLLPPQREGPHTIRIWARDEWMDGEESWRWGFDVLYDLTVVDVDDDE
jgi:hypothetical protein